MARGRRTGRAPGFSAALIWRRGRRVGVGKRCLARLLSSALKIAIAHLLGGGVADFLGLRVAWSAVTCVAFCHLLIAVALHSAAVCLLFVWLLLAVSCLLARICSRLRVLHHKYIIPSRSNMQQGKASLVAAYSVNSTRVVMPGFVLP